MRVQWGRLGSLRRTGSPPAADPVTRPGGLPARPAALFLAPEAPYPLHGGGSLRTASLLEYLLPRYDVDVLVFREPGAPDPTELLPAGVRSVTVLNLPSNGRSFMA